jgi:non-ribosomal peptide synthetase component F
VREDVSFAALVEQVRDRMLAASAHQEVPFDAVVAAVRPERAREETPLFRVLFTWHNEPRGTLTLAGLHWTRVPPAVPRSPFDLTLALIEDGEQLQAGLEYRTDLFEATTIARVAAQFESLVAGVAGDPHQALNDLTLLQDDEQQRLLAWSQVSHER